jgi:Mn2+/Fe2+ NRAMP family transporter
MLTIQSQGGQGHFHPGSSWTERCRGSALVASASITVVLVAVINGVTAGPFLIVVMRVSSDRAMMGESINGALARWPGWATTGLMLIAAVAQFATGGV